MRKLPIELVRDLVWLLRNRPNAFARLASQVRCVRIWHGRSERDLPTSGPA